MSTLRPAPDAHPAEWLLGADVWWWDLVRYGPPGFEERLFTGAIEVLRDAPSLAWFGEPSTYQEPHFVWPKDRARCVACEVDEEIQFTVGCSRAAARTVIGAFAELVREVEYGAPTPLADDTE